MAAFNNKYKFWSANSGFLRRRPKYVKSSCSAGDRTVRQKTKHK